MRGSTLVAACALLGAACHRPTPAGRAAALERSADARIATQRVLDARLATAEAAQALLLRQTGGDVAAQARDHERIAAAIANVDDLDATVEEFGRAAALYARAGDREGELTARAHQALGMWSSQLEPAVVALRATTREAVSAGLPRATALSMAFLGCLYQNQGLVDASNALFYASLPLLRLAGEADVEAVVEHQLGDAFVVRGDADRGLDHYQRAVAIARSARLPGRAAESTLDIARAYLWIRDDANQAMPYATRALVDNLVLGRTGNALDARYIVAELQSHLGDRAAALVNLESIVAASRKLGSEFRTMDTLAGLADVYRVVDRFPEARAAFAEVTELARKLHSSHHLNLSLIGGARLANYEKRYADAVPLVREFLDHIAAEEAATTDEQLRLSFAAATRQGSTVLVDALAGAGDVGAAFAASENMRARHLLAALGSRNIVDGAGAEALLDPDTTLVEYAFLIDDLVAFVVDAGSVSFTRVGNAYLIAREVRGWYQLATSGKAAPADLDAARRRLGAMLLAPLASKLHGARLAIVPDLGLHYVPFAALPLPDGQPLAARFELVHLASASVLAEQRRLRPARPRPQRAVAILADPIFDRADERLPGGAAPPAPMLIAARDVGLGAVVRLPSTRAEAEAIAALVPPGQAFVRLDGAATRAAAVGPEVASARIVHFATHGLLDNVHPEKAGLVLSMFDDLGAPLDGFLAVSEIEKLHLAADLVVLSACRTAIGKSFDGEGLVGVTRAFLRAGVPRVVSSLWQVDDIATAELMKRFYGGLLGRGLAPAAALRRAELELAADPRFSSPRLWAGFAFYGDWR